MLAVVVEFAKVPVDNMLEKVSSAPDAGSTLTVKVVLTGVLVANKVTGMGFVVPEGNWRSATASEPPGCGGGVNPPICEKDNVGSPPLRLGLMVAETGPGVMTTLGVGVIGPEKATLKAFKRILP